MNSAVKSLLFWVVIIIIGTMAWSYFNRSNNRSDLPFSDFMVSVGRGEISEVEISGNSISGKTKSGDNFQTFAPYQYEGLANKLIEHNVKIIAKDQSPGVFFRTSI